ncbi:MAG: transglutaminase domain-containing protein [Bacteroidia bacterium]
MRLFFIFTFLIFLFSAEGQLSKAEFYGKIDNQVFQYSKQHAKYPLNFDSVTTYVNKTFVTTETKVRAYYTWIALNIYYDMGRIQEMSDSKRFGIRGFESTTQNPDTVLARKFAVCEGFSKVMDRLCKASDIPSQMVVGYTKTSDGEVVQEMMHAWNAVKIDTAWGLLDVTWSNGYIDSKHVYNKRFSSQYFLTPPKEFLKDHLPLDPMWQLLQYPVSKKYFTDGDSLHESKKNVFNFNDSIAKYLKVDEDERKYTDYMHYHLYDPDNNELSRTLDILVYNKVADKFNIASIENEDFTLFFNNTLLKDKSAANFKKAKSMLESARSYLNTGMAYLKNKKAFTDEYEKIFKEMKEAGTKNLKIVQENTANLSKYQKSLGAQKRK